MVEVLELSGSGEGPDAARAAGVLERGGLVLLPELPFALSEAERTFLDPAVLAPKTKNVSYDPGTGAVGGTSAQGKAREGLGRMMARYAAFATALLERLAPGYAQALQVRRTSLRPGAVDTRVLSPRKDDRRLHVDAFPASPVQGRRILRVFTNVNPHRQARVWNIGEDDFETLAERLGPAALKPRTLSPWLMERLRITRGRRTDYDAAMLALHDGIKLDDAYQAQAPRRRMAFPPGMSWVVYTDGALHAALEGQHALEQTFLMPVSAMEDEARSPLRILERRAGRALT